jgi:hypothetical protein
MAVSGEDWSDWDSVSADGLGEIRWESGDARRVAEAKPSYSTRKKKR